MPVIDLPETATDMPGSFYYRTLAVMLFPKEADETPRMQWLASAMAGCYAANLDAGTPQEALAGFHPWIDYLWDLPQAPQRVYRDGQRRIERACLSGHMLLYLLALATHHQRHCKVYRAKALVHAFSEGAPAESSIEKIWPKFKSVSPLWAAMTLQAMTMATSTSSYLDFLAVAEAYRVASEALRILPPGSAWRPPRGLVDPATIEVDPLHESHLELLDREFTR